MENSPIWICYVYDGLIYFKQMWDQTCSRMVKTLFVQTRSIVHALNHDPCLMLLPWLSYRVCVNIFLVLPLYHQLIGVTFVEMWSTDNFPYLGLWCFNDTAPSVACSGFICLTEPQSVAYVPKSIVFNCLDVWIYLKKNKVFAMIYGYILPILLVNRGSW